MIYQELKSEQKLLGVRIIGWSVVISNVLLALAQFILPPALPFPIPVQLTQLISILAVYPGDFFTVYLKNFWVIHWVWLLVLFLCGVDILRFNKFARMIFILANIMHVVTLFYIVVRIFGSGVFMDYFFKLYFQLVVSGTYVGFLTLEEVREHFGIIIEGSQIRTWIQDLRRRFSLQPKNAKSYYNLGLTYRKLERFDEALEVLNKALAIRPQDPKIGYEVGVTLAKVKRFDEAIRIWKNVLKIDPFHREAYSQLALAYRQTGCSREAVRILEKIIPFYKQNADFFRELGEAYLAVGDSQEAVHAFKKAAELNPKDASAFFLAGRTYLTDLDRPQEAFDMMKRAIQQNPGHFQEYYYAGLACLKLNRFKDAVWYFKEAVHLNENDKDAHYQLGFAYAMIKDYPSARRQHEILTGIDQDLAQTLALLIKS